MYIPPSGYYRTLKNNATVQDVAGYMVDLIRSLDTDFFVLTEAEALAMYSQGNVLQDLANRAYEVAYFEPDQGDLQTLRTPIRTVRDQRANCVDYTIFIGAIANAMGLPVIVRIVQLPGQSNYGHVYPVVNGLPIDVVPVQREDGTEYLNRKPSVQPVIGKELNYLAKQDFFV